MPLSPIAGSERSALLNPPRTCACDGGLGSPRWDWGVKRARPALTRSPGRRGCGCVAHPPFIPDSALGDARGPNWSQQPLEWSPFNGRRLNLTVLLPGNKAGFNKS
jgi:hypothetical protein